MKPLDVTSDQRECPSQEQLEAFALGKLSSRSIEEIGEHLDTCRSCRHILEQLDASDDSLVGLLSEADGTLPEPSELRKLRRRLEQLPRRILGPFAQHKPSPAERDNGEPTFDRPIPHQLGQYKLVERISRGGMGVVYRAWHVRLKREVALKLLSPRRLDDEQSVSRFYREMEMIGQLDDHPHIVRARDAGQSDGFHYLVMDYVDGIDLSALLHRVGKLSVADACEVIRQAALGLDYAFEHGIVHRDVKPSNLMLTRSAEVKILDLGLAAMGKDVGIGEPKDDLVVGTADYMAPEQWTGSKEIDTRADVYALGCTFVKLLTGKAPYSSGDHRWRTTMEGHLREPVPSARSLRPDVPEELEAIMQRMMAKKPAHRYQRPGDVAAALEPLAKSHNLPSLVDRVEFADSDTDPAKADVTLAARSALRAAHKRAKRRRSVRWGVALALLVSSVAGLWWLTTIWYPSIELLLPDQHEHALYRYDKSRHEFVVHNDQPASFLLDNTQSPDYTFSTTVLKREWVGGAGLLFDHRVKERDDVTIHYCQLVWLHPAWGQEPVATHELCLTLLEIRVEPDSTRHGWIDAAIKPLNLDPKRRSHNNIRVEVVDHQVAQVYFNGRLVPELSEAIIAREKQRREAVALGDYGFFNHKGGVVFHSTEFAEDGR